MKKKNCKILVCTHKDFNYVANDSFFPILVGSSKNNAKSEYQRDDEGDNISNKNKNYCELTGLYWAWKNLENYDYIGLCHYRRYFNFKSKKNRQVTNQQFVSSIRDYSFEESFIEDFDVILSKPIIYPETNQTFYYKSHIPEDLKLLQDIIYENYPDYIRAYKNVMNRNVLYPYNMFIMNKENFNNYCEWLFAVLDKLESQLIVSHYPYQARVFGFLSERLLNVYVEHHNFRKKEIGIDLIVNNAKNSSVVQEFTQKFLKKTVFFLQKKIDY